MFAGSTPGLGLCGSPRARVFHLQFTPEVPRGAGAPRCQGGHPWEGSVGRAWVEPMGGGKTGTGKCICWDVLSSAPWGKGPAGEGHLQPCCLQGWASASHLPELWIRGAPYLSPWEPEKYITHCYLSKLQAPVEGTESRRKCLHFWKLKLRWLGSKLI